MGVFSSYTKIRNVSQIAKLFVTESTTKPWICSSSRLYSSHVYLEELYDSWLKDPASVHSSWDQYFKNLDNEPVPSKAGLPARDMSFMKGARTMSESKVDDSITEHLNVQGVIRSYQVRGHLVANLDPLGITNREKDRHYSGVPQEVLRQYKLDTVDMNRKFTLPSTVFIGGNEGQLPLKDIISRLEEVYCRYIGAEFMHLEEMDDVQWLRKKMEPPGVMAITPVQKKKCLSRLTRASGIENFLAKKWSSEKRFGLEGGEVLIPAIKQVIDKSSELGVDTFVLGCSHRGRLNVLANILRQLLFKIFTQFGSLEMADHGSGDVKYHLGSHITRMNRMSNKEVTIMIVANPSHLEAVCPVVQGITRARQFYSGDTKGDKVLGILIHGDAAFCGQGICYESMHLTNLPAYTTHGCIHMVVNNQVGFTTDPRHSRSSRYCTDVGKVVNCPIFHVNSDEPESVMHVCNIASEWRASRKKDFVIDIVCYRRNGHNEADEPMFTQPLMYQTIRKTEPIATKYAKKLISEGLITEDEVKQLHEKYAKICEESFEQSKKETQIKISDWLCSPWKGFFKQDQTKIPPTGVSEEILTHIGKHFSTPPPEPFVIHKGIDRILKGRMKLVEARTVDWALAEAMAWGSLLKEGVHVRLSGEDVERGTFSHRHHVLHHQSVDKVTYNPLTTLYPNQAVYSVSNSSLSEYGVLGFELGYSQVNPNALIMWEAQFGDFSNCAQCIIDQFIASGEAKWIRQTGLVMLLPHAMEGAGPEHSNARIERFLANSDDHDHEIIDDPVKQLHEINWIIANISTPANVFHVFRRQLAMPFRKPLIIFTPKSLLRLPECRSSFDDMLEGQIFRTMIPEEGEASQNPSGVRKLVFCSGHVYYDFLKARQEATKTKEIAIARVEQICPMPYGLIREECKKYANAEVFWGQEEHKNFGPWYYVSPRFKTLLGKDIGYIGRRIAPSAAVGNKFAYVKQFKKLTDDLLA